jgi:peptidoglycan hydrolase CwlO-like protein
VENGCFSEIFFMKKPRMDIGAVFMVAVFAVVFLRFSAVVAHAQVATASTTSATAAATSTATSSLQSQIDANNQQIASLNQQIAEYQAELTQAGADRKTLTAAISALDLERKKVQAQVAATEREISVTQLQIQQLGGEMVDTKATIATDQEAVAANLRVLQQSDGETLMMQVLRSGTLADSWVSANATLQVQAAVQNSMQELSAQEASLANSETASKQKQTSLAAEQQSLAAEQASLAATTQSKNQLLAATKAKESIYEQLLAAAQAELNSFSTFAENAGGSKLLAGQTDCDSWGCYYNQRDAMWGNIPLDGTKYKIASDGCLVTSLAMVMTHYGYHDVTPVTINSNPDNFAAYYPAYLLATVNVDGVTATRKTAAIDATLATGNPVIVGLHAYGGTHYVVFVSGRRGSYIMRDPYIADGKDISFAANYSLRDIFGVTKVVISS